MKEESVYLLGKEPVNYIFCLDKKNQPQGWFFCAASYVQYCFNTLQKLVYKHLQVFPDRNFYFHYIDNPLI
jgi:hypothetical protein